MVLVAPESSNYQVSWQVCWVWEANKPKRPSKLVEYEVVRNPTKSVAWHVARVPGIEPEISKLVQEEIWMEQPSLQGYFEELFPTHPHQKELPEGRDQER